MSRRTAIVEEFDDDTDLPLPNRPLPNRGTHGPVLEELYISDDEFEPAQNAGSASQPQQRFPPSTGAEKSSASGAVTDITPYKTWTCVYPIYVDAKRAYGMGERRIARQKSLWWPLSKDIADAANYLGLGVLHEVNKTHPRDWDNPGRVRVQWRKNGVLVNANIRTKKQLLEVLSAHVQRQKPDNVPRPPYTLASPKPVTAPTPGKSSAKGKQSASKASPAAVNKPSGRRLPIPPQPHPSLASRVSAYSPALPTGVLIETVKAGMNAQETAGTGAGTGAAGAQKGKRKVVRVRA